MTMIASHRGGAQVWPENSFTAFRNTAALKVDQVEFDVHPTRDGRLVVIHDPTLDRTTSGRGAVAEQDWVSLSRVTLNGTDGERLPLIEDVIAIFKSTAIDLRLEIKVDASGERYNGLEAQVVGMLRGHDMLARTVITSFQMATLDEVRRHGAPRMLIWLVSPAVLRDIGGIDDMTQVARRHDVPAVSLHHRTLDRTAVKAVRRAGLGIGGWAAHDDVAIRKMFELGVDVFTTDRPDRAVALRHELQEPAWLFS
jgi:glycerophosphoryl diester phosphodiesterase